MLRQCIQIACDDSALAGAGGSNNQHRIGFVDTKLLPISNLTGFLCRHDELTDNRTFGKYIGGGGGVVGGLLPGPPVLHFIETIVHERKFLRKHLTSIE